MEAPGLICAIVLPNKLDKASKAIALIVVVERCDTKSPIYKITIK